MLDELGLVVVKALRRNTILFAGAVVAVVTIKLFKRPLRSLAVAVTRGTLDISDRVTSTAGSIKKDLTRIVESAREEVKADADRKNKDNPAPVQVDPAHIKGEMQEPEESQTANNSVKVESPESDL